MSEVQTSNQDQEIKGSAYEPSPWEKVRYDWVDRATIRGLENTQIALVRMVTLASGMLFGGVAFLKTAVAPVYQVWFLVLMIVSLVAAIAGSTPLEWNSADDPDAIERNIGDIAKLKKVSLVVSLLFFLAALIVVSAGFIISIN